MGRTEFFLLKEFCFLLKESIIQLQLLQNASLEDSLIHFVPNHETKAAKNQPVVQFPQR